MKEIINKNLVPSAIILAGIIVAGVLFYINWQKQGNLSSQEAGETTINFINQSIGDTATASLIDIIDQGVVYKIHLKIAEQEYESYITKDAKFIFPTGIDLQAQPANQDENASLDEFAQCLTEKGMKIYGSKYCSWCQKQKDDFGDSFSYINYIECVNEETDEWSEECTRAGISSTPTWQFSDGTMSSGYKSLEDLAGISGCQLK
ncbi:MAG: hypothetical protein Q8P63_01650 [Candidatus Nealsonbacteria bacterium]|nr:hypothetical protein [Candidatus Nealsonbacteria bacterium]